MNPFLKKNSPWLGLLGLALFIILLAFIFRPESLHYQIDTAQSLKIMNDQGYEVPISNVAGKQLIDIRSAELFAQGHPENAINIPVRQILDESSIELFQQLTDQGKEAVLCGMDELQATAPWLLLQQLGIKNVKRLKGGISPGGALTETALASSETSVVDTSAIRYKSEVPGAPVKTAAKKKAETVIPVRKEASTGGGC
jgi:rhodanese-related sulfurtransferase